MNRHVIALIAVLIFGSLQGWPQEPPSEPTVRLKIELTLADGAVFYIPAVGDGEVLGIVTLPERRFVGVRITPRMRSDSIQIAYSDDVNGGFQRDVNERSGDVNKVGAQRRWNGHHA